MLAVISSVAWVHDLDPFILQFTENFGLRWYGMAYLTGFVVGALFMIFIAKRGRETIPAELVTDFITYVVLGTMVGGRLGYAVFYSPELLTEFSGKFPFWGVLKVWEGGMASHGGIAGIIVASMLFAWRYKLNWLHLGDLTVLGGSIGIFFGRLANFINGELFGREASSSLPWAVKFPSEIYLWYKQDVERRLTDTGADLLPKLTDAVQTLGTDPEHWRTWTTHLRTDPVARSQIHERLDQIIVAVQNGNEALRADLAAVLTARHPSQIYEALLEGLFLFTVSFLFWRRPRSPGLVGAVWLTLYAVVRIIGEQFRMPDAHIGYQLFGLTRGQWISIGMLAVSGAFLFWIWRRRSPPIAGWGRQE